MEPQRAGRGDATLAFLREGYAFIPNRCARLGTDAFRTRIMLRDAVCLTGPRGVRLLYGAPGLTRRGAMPRSVLHLLQDEGSIQTLDGAAHHRRKALFWDMLGSGGAAAALAARFEEDWTARLLRERETCVLHSASYALATVAARWAGLGRDLSGDPRFRRDLFLMVDRAGRVGPELLRALGRRRRAERRVAAALDAGVPPDSPAGRIAAFVEDGRPLPRDVAVVEILNLLRPVTAIGRYMAFAARRLVIDPVWRERLAVADDEGLRRFAEEIRRTAPFFPLIGAIATEPVVHEGLTLAPGQWVLADLWGTMQDPARFPDPQAFRPDRDLDWRAGDDSFVPQGGGVVSTTHRCPGDPVSVALIVAALRVLCRRVDWTAPPQDLSVSLSRMPAQPASGVRLSGLAAATAPRP
ncbi:cytochrome P450 [Roseivivax isoporae]|uniref:Cytochrome P450 n=1 Tax=Roseivivax isoporae LMG 25204 TaxID=1449351 RepID=X7FAF2_9RHOB|nr:cytochrome P450 [Roseivivax isoporae]ETX29029.1 hypothetical protein RISW2_03550 [Roseivivax isoporae LMG 25204]